MKRWAFVLGALAIGMAASSRQAEAGYSIIRWTSGFCQVWDNSTPWKPFPSDYIVGPILSELLMKLCQEDAISRTSRVLVTSRQQSGFDASGRP